MIYTITFSPSIDYVINSENKFNFNGLNRVTDYELVPGGKGINASIVLSRIGYKNQAITFTGGKTKLLFEELIHGLNIDLFNIDVETDTRINVKMFSDESSFEINGKKTEIDSHKIDLLLKKINDFNQDDIVLIMGYCDDNYIHTILKILSNKNIKFILDIDSNEMINFLKYNPYLIKPNLDELQRILNKKIENQNEIIEAMNQLQEKGCQNILISNGSKGSYLLTHDKQILKVKLKKVDNVVSTVGAGDTLISSFGILYLNSNDPINSLKQATSLSIGTIKTKFLASKDDINKYFELIEVTNLK